jgi:hypothetical protein
LLSVICDEPWHPAKTAGPSTSLRSAQDDRVWAMTFGG